MNKARLITQNRYNFDRNISLRSRKAIRKAEFITPGIEAASRNRYLGLFGPLIGAVTSGIIYFKKYRPIKKRATAEYVKNVRA